MKVILLVNFEVKLLIVRGVFWAFFTVGGKAALSCTLVLQGINVLQNSGDISNEEKCSTQLIFS